MINLPWVLRENELAAELGFPVELLNDLHATANAIPHLGRDDLLVLNEGTAFPGGAIAVIAPGTGLGESFLTWDGTRYRPHASEGGHADFAPEEPPGNRALRLYPRPPRPCQLRAHLLRPGHIQYLLIPQGQRLRE